MGPGEVGGTLHRAPPSLADPPTPQGVVRVHLRGARDLRSKDRFMGGLVEGKSDPYAVLRVGTQVVTSRVIDDNLNPTWDEVYEVRYPPLHWGPPQTSWGCWGLQGPPCPPPTWLQLWGTQGHSQCPQPGCGGRSTPNTAELDRGTPVRSPAWLCLGGGVPPASPPTDPVPQFIVHEVPGQEMEVELFDKDPDQDDLLGRCGGAGPPG